MSVTPEPTSFRFGYVLRQALLIVWRNASQFLPIALAIMVPQTLFQIVFSVDPDSSDLPFLDMLGQVLQIAIAGVSWALVTICLVYAVLQAAHGQIVDLRLSIEWGKPRALSAIIVALMLEVLISIPFVLLVGLGGSGQWAVAMIGLVCSLYAAVVFAVALPVLLVERCGIADCLKRSLSLTAGCRWQIAAIWFVTVAAASVIDFFFEEIATMLSGESVSIASHFLIELLDNTIFVLFGSVVSIVMYLELRNLKDGPNADSVAEIFD